LKFRRFEILEKDGDGPQKFSGKQVSLKLGILTWEQAMTKGGW
jgi:hypothetical protein